MTLSENHSVASKFHSLHESGCFVLPNPWDIGTAIYLQRLGFKALATTSAGFAFSRGKRDGGVPRDEMLAHIREIVEATPLPVNADFQSGYADEPEGVAANVRLCLATGVAGLSIEDNTGRTDAPLYEKELAVDRIRAARAVIDASETGVVLTGRCEAWLVGDPDPLRTARLRPTSTNCSGKNHDRYHCFPLGLIRSQCALRRLYYCRRLCFGLAMNELRRTETL